MKLSNDVQMQLGVDYKDGLTLKDLATKHNVSTVTIYNALKRQSITMRSRGRRKSVTIDDSVSLNNEL